MNFTMYGRWQFIHKYHHFVRWFYTHFSCMHMKAITFIQKSFRSLSRFWCESVWCHNNMWHTICVCFIWSTTNSYLSFRNCIFRSMWCSFESSGIVLEMSDIKTVFASNPPTRFLCWIVTIPYFETRSMAGKDWKASFSSVFYKSLQNVVRCISWKFV